MITVFTATYNRAYILPGLYKSLQEQTSISFEWVIVDDGSTDNTEELIKQWEKESNEFQIRYIKQKNSGKHVAINQGVKAAKGEAFFIVDSDDKLPPNAIKEIEQEFVLIVNDKKYLGICGLKGNIENLKPLGNSEHMKNIDCSMIDIRQKYGIKGDMAEVFKTDILRQYPFPVFEGENFISEGAVWRKLSYKYILRYIPKVWYLCKYLPDGLTQNIRRKYRNNPQGTAYLFNTALTDKQESWKRKVYSAILYWRYLCMQEIGYKNAVWWSYLFLPVGILVFLYDSVKESK